MYKELFTEEKFIADREEEVNRKWI